MQQAFVVIMICIKKIESARDKEKSALQNKCQGKKILPVCHLIDNSFPNTNSTTIDKSWNHWRCLHFCIACLCPFKTAETCNITTDMQSANQG